MSLFRCLSCTKVSVQVRGIFERFVTSHFLGRVVVSTSSNPTSWRTTRYRLSATAYSIYSQLPSICGGGSIIRNLRKRHTVVKGSHLSWLVLLYYCITNYKRVRYFSLTVFNLSNEDYFEKMFEIESLCLKQVIKLVS